MTITDLPTVPDILRGKQTYVEECNDFVAALPPFVVELNELQLAVEAAEENSLLAETNSLAFSNRSTSIENFEGVWGDLTGAAAVPFSVYHVY